MLSPRNWSDASLMEPDSSQLIPPLAPPRSIGSRTRRAARFSFEDELPLPLPRDLSEGLTTAPPKRPALNLWNHTTSAFGAGVPAAAAVVLVTSPSSASGSEPTIFSSCPSA